MSDNINPTGSTSQTAVDLIPKFYQTRDNVKFIQSTIDQLVQKGTTRKVSGYIGRENAKSANGNDVFVNAADSVRQNYQLEPGVLVNDQLGNTQFFKDYIDYINQLSVFGGNTDNHERINTQEFYSWDPHINWDKFSNFQQYYWLPYGPETITIYGQQKNVISTYTVVIDEALGTKEYLFTPNGLTRNPSLVLYRGQTYHFNVTSTGVPQPSIWRIEHGLILNPKTSLLKKLAAALEVSMDYLATEENDPSFDEILRHDSVGQAVFRGYESLTDQGKEQLKSFVQWLTEEEKKKAE